MKSLELLLTLVTAVVTESVDDGWMRQAFEPPYFDTSTPKNVTALQGKTAYLHCKVKRLNNKTVSWIRARDLHILTAGTTTFTNDERFQVARDAARNDWTLMIKFAQRRDSGLYECQISTQPATVYPVYLQVVEPESKVLGGNDLFINRGSLLNLTCVVKNSPQPPEYIFWYHGSEVISYDSKRGGVTVLTDKGDITTSHLLIREAQPSDSGNYSCHPSNARVASINVHVLQGELPAAMQTSSSLRPSCSRAFLVTAILLSLWLFGT